MGEVIERIYEDGVLTIDTTGHVSVAISADGLPSFEALVPCPMMPIGIREFEVAGAKDAIYMQGYFITADKLIRNKAFDKGGEKTTTQLSARVCKNEEEAKFVIGKVKAIIEKGIPNEILERMEIAISDVDKQQKEP